MRWLLAIVGIGVLIGLVAWLTGSGANDPGDPPFSATDSQARVECLTGTYVPSGWKLAKRPVPRNWETIENAPGALQPERSVVQVILSPEQPGTEITLKSIHLDIEPHPFRPLGVAFYRPCHRQLVGPAIEGNLEASDQIEASNSALNGTLGTGLHIPASAKPIRFPWKITLRKPLHLYLVTHGEHIYCSWSARIPWSSNSSEGVIQVDNGGKQYWHSDSIGLPWDRPEHGQWVRGPAPRWIEETR